VKSDAAAIGEGRFEGVGTAKHLGTVTQLALDAHNEALATGRYIQVAMGSAEEN
jgi:hypothetical protein